MPKGALILAWLVASSALAETPAEADIAAGDLGSYCSDRTGQSQLLCTGYIQGVIDSFEFVDNTLAKTPIGAGIFTCMPRQVPEPVVEAIVKRYILAHPEKRAFGAASVIGAALNEAYPCAQSPN